MTAYEAGMHVVGWLPDNLNDVKAARLAATHKVDVPPLSAYAINEPSHGGVLMGYTALSPPVIRAGIRRLAKAWSTQLRSHDTRPR